MLVNISEEQPFYINKDLVAFIATREDYNKMFAEQYKKVAEKPIETVVMFDRNLFFYSEDIKAVAEYFGV